MAFVDQITSFGFDKHSVYYQFQNSSSLNPDVRAWTVREEGGHDWRVKLKVNDKVDVHIKAQIRTNGDTFSTKQWRQAVITGISGEYLLLQFLKYNDHSIEKNRYSRAIAPYESMTKQDYESRARCLTDASKLPIKVDCLAMYRGWEVAEIVRIDDA